MAEEKAPIPLMPALLAGALAGTLDITAACIQTLMKGRTPERMLQGIASGWLGRASYSGGAGTAALGFATHYFIATTAATVFWLTSRRYPQLVRHAWAWGAAYGLVVYAVMYEIVIPLSAIHHHVQRTPQDYITQLAIHVCCIGWPIALVARAHTARRDIEPVS